MILPDVPVPASFAKFPPTQYTEHQQRVSVLHLYTIAGRQHTLSWLNVALACQMFSTHQMSPQWCHTWHDTNKTLLLVGRCQLGQTVRVRHKGEEIGCGGDTEKLWLCRQAIKFHN